MNLKKSRTARTDDSDPIIPSLAELGRFFLGIVEGIEDFVDEWFIQPLEEFAADVHDLQEALELIAGHLPEPDPDLKRHVCTLYDVQKALLEYQRDNLKTLLSQRYTALWQAFKAVFTRSIVKNLILQLITLRWGQCLGFILRHGLSLTLVAVGAEELYHSLSTDLSRRLSSTSLRQDRPRVLKHNAHYTRKV